MIKFLLYLFVFYVIFRLLFGKALGGTVKTKVFRFNTHHHHYNNTPNNETHHTTQQTTINPNAKTVNKQNDKHIGEYVDYEEVK